MLLKDLGQMEVVYRVDRDGWCFYLGKCLVSELSRVPDMRWNPKVCHLLDNPEFLEGATITLLAWNLTNTEKALDEYYIWRDAIAPVKKGPDAEWIPRPNIAGRKTRAVYCVETSALYPSATVAALENEIDPANMSRHLKGFGKTVKGLRFRYEDEE